MRYLLRIEYVTEKHIAVQFFDRGSKLFEFEHEVTGVNKRVHFMQVSEEARRRLEAQGGTFKGVDVRSSDDIITEAHELMMVKSRGKKWQGWRYSYHESKQDN